MNRKQFIEKGVNSVLSATMVLPIIAACNSTNEGKLSPNNTEEVGTTNGSSASDCTITPSETAGPFPTKKPGNFIINDITADRKGVKLTIDIAVKNKNNGCEPLAGAIVDIWHCDNNGDYSEYGSSASQDFLRGRQTCDVNGVAKFISIFPGWYPGRAPHVHVEIFNAVGKSILVTQMAFPATVCDTVYTKATNFYTKGSNYTSNSKDGILNDGFALEMPMIIGSVENGYTLKHNIVVKG